MYVNGRRELEREFDFVDVDSDCLVKRVALDEKLVPSESDIRVVITVGSNEPQICRLSTLSPLMVVEMYEIVDGGESHSQKPEHG